MNKKKILSYTAIALTILATASCSGSDDTPEAATRTPMTFLVTYPGQTRATETAFEDGDRIGLFVADTASTPDIGGNLVNNEALTLGGATWAATHTLYWDGGTYNAYAYYPYTDSITSISEQPFSVSTDQSTTKSGSTPGGYEASDLLFASASNVKASASPIALNFHHIMSKLRIRLIKGEDFEGDMPTTAQVYVHNTVPDATIDLTAGVATRNPKAMRQTIHAHQESDYT